MVESAQKDRIFALCIGIAFLLLGVLSNVLSVTQYRRSVASLGPMEIPPRYWINLPVVTSLAVSFLGLLLCVYLLKGV